MRVSLTGRNAEDLKLILNAVVQSYYQEAVKKDEQQRADRRQRLKDASTRYQQELSACRRRYLELGDIVTKHEGALARDQYAATVQEWTRVNFARLAAKAKLQVLLAKKPDPASQSQRCQLEDEIAVLSEQHKLLTEEVERLSHRIRNAVDGSDLAAKDELDNVSATAKRLRDLVESADLESGSGSRVSIQDRAYIR
jgi:hypothetical protein